MKTATLLALAAGMFLASTQSRAEVSATMLTGANGTFSVYATDLADTSQGGTVSFPFPGSANYGSDAAKLIDGGVYGGEGFNGTANSLTPSVNDELILNLAPSASGWDLDKIVVLTGVHPAQIGRSDHGYTIALSTDGTNFGPPIINVNSAITATEVQTTIDDGNTPLGTGIKAIKFVFSNAAFDAENMYREIDVLEVGSPTATVLTGGNGTFSVSSTDLADTSQSGTVSFTGTLNYGSDAAKVLDGSTYSGGPFNEPANSLTPSVNDELILNLAPSVSGWDLDRIVVLTGVDPGGAQNGRSDHGYTIALSTDGTTFGPPIINMNSAIMATEVQTTIDNGNTPLGTGIKAIKFVFSNAAGEAENMYREIDVLKVGTPTATVLAGANGTFSVSSTDLADASQSGTVSFTGSLNYGSNAAKLIDGSVYNEGASNETANTLTPSVNDELILNLAPSVSGWDLDKIVVLTGVDSGGQLDRSDHGYTIALSTDGINFGTPIIYMNSAIIAAEVQTTIDSGNTPLGTGIKAVKFVFSNATGAPENMYREIDVLGEPVTDAPFQLIITPNGVNPGNYDFVWNSLAGKVYDLVTSVDLATPVSSWPVWDGKSGLPAAGDGTNELTDIPGGGGPKRFFAVVERDP